MQRQIAAVWQKGSVLSPAAATLLKLATDLLSQEGKPLLTP
jgi:hypothetical protein